MSGSVQTPGASNIRAPAQGQAAVHTQTSQMAHIAAQRAAVSRVLANSQGPALSAPPTAAPGIPSGSPMSPPDPAGNFKNHVLHLAGKMGKPAGTHANVHAAIAKSVQAGSFSPAQGAALANHNGPLMGQAGANTLNTLAQAM